jgi:hypothetical protein
VTQTVEFIACCLIAKLRLITECKERLLATGITSGLGDLQNRLTREIGWLIGPRRMSKGAIVANISAKLGQRDEDLARI